MELKCCRCKKVKDISCFYKDRFSFYGYIKRCKDCQRLYYRERRIKKPAVFKKKDATYYQKNKKKILTRRKAWYKENGHKRKCHEAVKNALYKGELTRKPCEVCGSEKVVAHHDDYTKPLDVRWLCQQHHMRHHHGK